MDVSDRDKKLSESTGMDLLTAVVSLTGLPESQVQNELGEILSQTGVDPHQMTLEQLRSAMVAYLDFVQQDMLSDPSQPDSPPSLDIH